MKFNLFFILSLLSLYSCGGGKSTVKLEVTRSFVTGNSIFDGGLYIIGKNNTNGDEFAVSLTTQSSTSLTLNYGNWEITAIGWDNNERLFEGDVLCGTKTINFKKEIDSAPITVSTSGCADLNPKLLKIYTCGALYDPSNPSSLVPSSTITDTFCDDYPPAWQNKAKSLKISLLDKLPGGNFTDGITSACIQTTSSDTGKYLSNKLPIKITLYDDQNCLTTRTIGSYQFPKGLVEYSQIDHPFDAVINSSQSDTMLALSPSISSRGITPFLTEIPSFNCGTNSYCFQLPNLPTDIDYVVSNGSNTISIPITSSVSCSNINFTSSTSTSYNQGSQQTTDDFVKNGCYIDSQSGNMILHLEVNQFYQTTQSSKYFSIDGGTTKKFVLIDSPAKETFKNLIRILGAPSTTNNIKNSFIENNEGPNNSNGSMGMLSESVDILSPGQVGGIFWDQTCSTSSMSAPVKRNISFNEEGMEKNYQLILTNPPSNAVPKYIGYSTDSWGETISQTFNRRIIVRYFLGPIGYKTEMVMDIACDGVSSLGSSDAIQIGKVESVHIESDPLHYKLSNQRRVIFWNTNQVNKSRFENYEFEEEFNTSTSIPTLLRRNHSFTRAEKFDTTVTKVNRMNYSYDFNDMNNSDPSDDWKQESLDHNEMAIFGQNITVYPSQRIEKQNSNMGSIYQEQIHSKSLETIRYNRENINNKIKMISANKIGSVRLITNKFYINHFSCTGTNCEFTPNLSTGNTISSFDFDVSPDGEKMILAVSTTGSSTVYAYIYNGSSWSTQTQTVSGSTGVYKIKTRILNDGSIVIAAVTNYQDLYYGITDSSSTPSTYFQLPSINKVFENYSGSANVGTGTTANFSPSVFDVDIAKDSSNFWIFRKYMMTFTQIDPITNTPTTTYNDGINYCKLSASSPNCTNGTNANIFAIEETSSQIQNTTNLNFSLFNSDDLQTIKISYLYGSDIKTKTWTIGTNGISTTDSTQPISNYQTGYPPSSFNLNTSTFNPAAGTPTILINTPYQKPAVTNFNMNYKSLKPNVFESTVFTGITVFQAIGSEL